MLGPRRADDRGSHAALCEQPGNGHLGRRRATLPRYRYDQLMRLGWKVFLPLSLAMVAIVAAVLQFGGLAPK